MAETSQPRVAFDDRDTRPDEMHRTIETWLDELLDATEEARSSQRFQDWLDVQSRFPHYSYRNTLLIAQQRPNATNVAGYRAWQEEFHRQVKRGERAIWIWAPIVARRCPECENSKPYHERSECAYDDLPPEEWPRGLVGFKPVPVFDVSQTEGEPLPDLETAAVGEATGLVDDLEAIAEDFDVSLELIPVDVWPYGRARGVCQWSKAMKNRPRVSVRADLPHADLALTLIHEYAHALLHVDEADERANREVEAEAVAYVVGRHLELDPRGSSFYLASWAHEPATTIEARLGRIRNTAARIIAAVAPSGL